MVGGAFAERVHCTPCCSPVCFAVLNYSLTGERQDGHVKSAQVAKGAKHGAAFCNLFGRRLVGASTLVETMRVLDPPNIRNLLAGARHYINIEVDHENAFACWATWDHRRSSLRGIRIWYRPKCHRPDSTIVRMVCSTYTVAEKSIRTRCSSAIMQY